MVFSWALWFGSAYLVYHYSIDLAHTVWLEETIGNDFIQIFAVFSGDCSNFFGVRGVADVTWARFNYHGFSLGR